MIVQNRVNPESLEKVMEEKTGDGEYWVSPSEKDVRPYGFCVQEVLDD